MKQFLLIALTLSSAVIAQAQNVLKLKVTMVENTPTERVYNFTTINFVDIIGWQFRMDFDGTKMKFKEIRNAIHPSQTTGNFYEPTPGQLRSVWIDTDLEANNFPDTTVLFQLAFELLDPDATPLCFEASQENFEFIMMDGSDFTLTEILISDDCYQGFSIFLDGSSTENPVASIESYVTDVFLSTTGNLSFTSTLDQELEISLYDLTGKPVVSFTEKGYAIGRNTVQSKAILPGIYIMKVIAEDGKVGATKVYAY